VATITLGNAQGMQPPALHAGLNTLICRLSLSVTLSVGDIHIIGKLPHGAIPTDAVFYGGAAYIATSTGQVQKMGTSASPDMFFASATFSITPAFGVQRTTRRLGTSMQISLSDDIQPRYENVVFVGTSSTFTVGHIGDLVIEYVMPGSEFARP
jgi:hypothetical protein